jgi:transcriptional regulator GlxA family with amidase domain
VFLVYPGIQGLDLVGPLEVFTGASSALAELAPHRPRYETVVVSARGGAVKTESHLSINTTAVDTIDVIDTLVIPGGFGAPGAADDAAVVDAVKSLARGADRVVTVCTGTFVAAAAGLLDGRRVCTHWARAGALRRRFPDLEVDTEPIFVRDGHVWTSAGVTAGIDLALALVEADHGAEVAQVVARWLVMFLRRPGGQTQFAAPVWSERAAYEPIRAAQDLIEVDPGADHRVGLLADRVGMSERHFTRRFTEEVGVSPAQYVAAVRVEAARRELESTTATVDLIARRCGFGTSETMRRTFARRIGVSPDQYRQRFRTPIDIRLSQRTPA